MEILGFASRWPCRAGGVVSRRLNRPNVPDPGLLREAGVSAAEFLRLGSSAVITWQIGERIDRPRSSVFPLKGLASTGHEVAAFYKVAHPPNQTLEQPTAWETEHRQALTAGPGLEARLASLAEGKGIQVSQTLAVEPDSLILVTLAVAGTPLGRFSRQSLTAARRTRALDSVKRAGIAARLIEECSPHDLEIPDRLRGLAVIQRRLDRIRKSLSNDVMLDLESLMIELEQQAMSSPRPVVYSHGDFNTSNVLVTTEGIGLIDFSWLQRLRNSDVAHFAFRMEYEPWMSRSWASELVTSLIEGYGDHGLVGRPSWQFLRLSKLLRVVQRGSGSSTARHRRLARRARAEIKATLKSAS